MRRRKQLRNVVKAKNKSKPKPKNTTNRIYMEIQIQKKRADTQASVNA